MLKYTLQFDAIMRHFNGLIQPQQVSVMKTPSNLNDLDAVIEKLVAARLDQLMNHIGINIFKSCN